MLNKRRTLISLFGVLLLMTLVFGCARRQIFAFAEDAVAKVDGVDFTTFEEALSNWNEGQTLHLLKDSSVPNGESIKITQKKTLDLTGYTLSGDKLRTIWIEEGGSLTIKDSVNTGKITGGGIRVEGELILEGGTITQNTAADDGGGVYVLSEGKFTMTGGSITQNVAAGRGGGVFAEGEVTLGKDAQIFDNVGKEKAESNLYLPAGNFIHLSDDFAGKVGVALSTSEGTISESFKAGIFADDKLYETRESEGKLELRLSPLQETAVSYTGEEKFFPTTELERLWEHLTLTYTNKNGVPYPIERIKSRSLQVVSGETRTKEFFVGEDVVEVEVTGRDGEKVSATFSVHVDTPALLKAEVFYTQNRIFHFDSEFSVEDFREDLLVRGTYEDNHERRIYPTAEETSQNNGGYIFDFYTLSGSFSEVSGGKARVTISVPQGEQALECEFYVNVTRYTIYTSEIELRQVKISEGEGTQLSAADFVPSLPRGVVANARREGETGLDSSALSAGIYGIVIDFSSENQENFEIMGPAGVTRLLVYAKSYTGRAGNMSFVVTCEGGISPEWSFTMKQTQPKVYLRSGLSSGNTFELTFFPWESEDIPTHFSVKIMPERQIAQKERLYLFSVNGDGSTQEISSSREETAVLFETNSLNETTFCIAVENNDRLFIILSVCFVVLCIGCAGAFAIYLKKRK